MAKNSKGKGRAMVEALELVAAETKEPADRFAGLRARSAEAAKNDDTIFVATDQPLDPRRKGLVVKVHQTLSSLGSATVAQVADALVTSGQWTSKAEPVVPIRTWLRQFVTQGIAKVV